VAGAPFTRRATTRSSTTGSRKARDPDSGTADILAKVMVKASRRSVLRRFMRRISVGSSECLRRMQDVRMTDGAGSCICTIGNEHRDAQDKGCQLRIHVDAILRCRVGHRLDCGG
jgi:hypothetical protein